MRLIALICISLFSLSAQADIANSLKSCASIVDNFDRLTCYDKLSKNLPETKAVNAEAPPAQSTKVTTSVTPPVKAEVAVTTTNQADNFGKQASQADQVQSIQSTIVGEFKGWKKGSIIKLSNGQKWKVVSQSKGYTKMKNPEVEVERGVFGSFNMRVKGFKLFAKVKRIK